MASSLSRLRSLFSVTKNSVSTLPKPTISTPLPKPVSPEDIKFEIIVKKFKRASRSSRFRHRSQTSYSNIVSRLAHAKKYNLIEEIIEHQKQYEDVKTEGFAVRLMGLYGKCGMFSHARKFFDEMADLKCERTVKSFNVLLAACVKCKEFDKIGEIFKRVPEELNIEPDVVSYNTVMKAFCEMGELDNAVSVFEEMEKDGVEPDLISFNTLSCAFYANDRFSEGEKVWEKMVEKNIVPNFRSYNPKLRALVKSDRISEAAELIEEMKKGDIELDSFSYNSLIKGFCDLENMEEAKKWFAKMGEDECKPDRVTYLMMGYLACKMDDFDYAFEVCKEAIEEKLVIHKTLAQLVVNGLVKESKIEEADELVKVGNENGYYCYDLKLPQTEESGC